MAERITVTPAELQKAIAIWITTAPKRIWRDYWQHSETAGKWSAGSDPFNRFDPRHAMAEYLAERFKQVGWQITYEKERPHGWGPEPKAEVAAEPKQP